MAKKFQSNINLSRGRYAILAESAGGDTYGTVKMMAGLQTAAIAVTLQSGKHYGDGVMLDETSEFDSGKIDITSAGESDETQAELLGHTIDNEEIIYDGNDAPPYIGYGAINTIKSKEEDGDAVKGYIAFFFPKMKFSEPNEDMTAKQGSITYGTTKLTATILLNSKDKWKYKKKFTGETAIEDAEEYLASKFVPVSG